MYTIYSLLSYYNEYQTCNIAADIYIINFSTFGVSEVKYFS